MTEPPPPFIRPTVKMNLFPNSWIHPCMHLHITKKKNAKSDNNSPFSLILNLYERMRIYWFIFLILKAFTLARWSEAQRFLITRSLCFWFEPNCRPPAGFCLHPTYITRLAQLEMTQRISTGHKTQNKNFDADGVNNQ